MDEGLQELIDLFKDREWYHSVGYDNYGRYVVYIHYTCHETLHDIPDRVAGKQVLCHFGTSKTATADQYTNNGNHVPFAKKTLELVDVTNEEPEVEIIELPSDLLEADISDLCQELDRLERQVGSNCLQDIFYEVHDGKNAVTNLSARYPDVRASMERLYDEYGFDVIYEEMDG